MPLVSRKGILAIAAVIDVAIHARSRPVSAKALAARHKLPPRHLEPVLQALVRDGILRGVRGPHGGYELGARTPTHQRRGHPARRQHRRRWRRAAAAGVTLINDVVKPALLEAERTFSVALGRITVDDMAKRAEALEIATITARPLPTSRSRSGLFRPESPRG